MRPPSPVPRKTEPSSAGWMHQMYFAGECQTSSALPPSRRKRPPFGELAAYIAPFGPGAIAKTSDCSAFQTGCEVPSEAIRKTRPECPVAAYTAPSEATARPQRAGCPMFACQRRGGPSWTVPSEPNESPENRPFEKSAYPAVSHDVLVAANSAVTAQMPT